MLSGLRGEAVRLIQQQVCIVTVFPIGFFSHHIRYFRCTIDIRDFDDGASFPAAYKNFIISHPLNGIQVCPIQLVVVFVVYRSLIGRKQIPHIHDLRHGTAGNIKADNHILNSILCRIGRENQHISVIIKDIIMMQIIVSQIKYIGNLSQCIHLSHLICTDTVIHAFIRKQQTV